LRLQIRKVFRPAGAGYTRDRIGRATAITDDSGTRTLSYNGDGSLLTEQYGAGMLSGLGSARTYDSLGRRTALAGTLSQPYSASYSYNTNNGKLSQIHWADGLWGGAPEGYFAAYDYSTSGRLTGLTRGTIEGGWDSEGLWLNRGYDAKGRLTYADNYSYYGDVPTFGYTYDARDLRTRVDLVTGEYWSYGYDSKGQLTQGELKSGSGETVPGMAYGYAYVTYTRANHEQSACQLALKR